MAIRLQFEDGKVEKFSTIYMTGNRIFNCWAGYGHNDDEWAQLCGGVGLHPQYEDSFEACSHIACAVKAAKERNGKYDYYHDDASYAAIAVLTVATGGLALALLPFVYCYKQSKKPARIEEFNNVYPYLLHYQETYDPITGWGVYGDGRRARNISKDEAVEGKPETGFSHAVFGSSEWNASLAAYRKKERDTAPNSKLPAESRALTAKDDTSLDETDSLEFERLRRLTVIQRAKELGVFAGPEAYDRYYAQNRDILEQGGPPINIDHPDTGGHEVRSPVVDGPGNYIGMAYFEKFQKTNSSIPAGKKKGSRRKKSDSLGKTSPDKPIKKRKPKVNALAKTLRPEYYEVYYSEEKSKKEVKKPPKKKETVREYRDLFKNN